MTRADRGHKSAAGGSETMVFDIYVNPGNAPWPLLADAARVAEAAGFETLWTIDHLAGETVSAPEMPECFTTLGALAAVTSTIRLGPLVANAANRMPAITANAAATLQRISGGRCILGLGAGSAPGTKHSAERRAVGVEQPPGMAERHAVLLGTLDLIDDLWAVQRREELRSFIHPGTRPPVLIGANSVELARIAGRRADGVNVCAHAPYARDVITAAIAARDDRLAGSGEHHGGPREEGFMVSVWEHFDERFLGKEHMDERIEEWRRWGVNRVILLMFHGVDLAALERAGAHLLQR